MSKHSVQRFHASGDSAPSPFAKKAPDAPSTVKRTEGRWVSAPLRRLVEVVQAHRAKLWFRAHIKEADKQLSRVISAAVLGDEDQALEACTKVANALKPLAQRLRNHQGATGFKDADIRELCGERLIRGEFDLRKQAHGMSDHRLRMLDEHLAAFDPTLTSPVIAQLKRSVTAEVLRRKMERIDTATAAPQGSGGKRALGELSLKELDDLDTLVQDLQTTPKREITEDDTDRLTGMHFNLSTLQRHANAIEAALGTLQAADRKVDAFLTANPGHSVDKLSATDVKALREAVDALIKASNNTPRRSHVKLQNQLHARELKDKKQVETLLKGPVDAFDPRDWTDEDLVELQGKLAPLKWPTTKPLEQQIQVDIDRRMLKARNEFESALRAAVRSDNEVEASKHLRQSAVQLHEAEALYARLDEKLGKQESTLWINDALASLKQMAPTELKRRGDILLTALETALQAPQPPLSSAPGPIASGYQSTLSHILEEALETVKPSSQANEPPQKVSKAPSREELNLADARFSIQSALENGVKGMGRMEVVALMQAITSVLKGSQDLHEIADLQKVINALGSAGIRSKSLEELSDLLARALAGTSSI